MSKDFESLARTLGAGNQVDPVHYIRAMEQKKDLTAFTHDDWREFLASPKSERFVTILFALRNHLSDLALLLLFSDILPPEWETHYGDTLFPLSNASACAQMLAKFRKRLVDPLVDVLGMNRGSAVEELMKISRLKLDVQSDYRDFYDSVDTDKHATSVAFKRFSYEELDRQRLRLLLNQHFRKRHLRFFRLSDFEASHVNGEDWWWVYSDERRRRETDFTPVRREELFSGRYKPEQWCSPLPTSIATGAGVWRTLILVGHLSWIITHSPSRQATVNVRSVSKEDKELGLISPVLCIKIFEPLQKGGLWVVCDVMRRPILESVVVADGLDKLGFFVQQRERCQNAVALFLYLYGKEVLHQNEALKAD